MTLTLIALDRPTPRLRRGLHPERLPGGARDRSGAAGSRSPRSRRSSSTTRSPTCARPGAWPRRSASAPRPRGSSGFRPGRGPAQLDRRHRLGPARRGDGRALPAAVGGAGGRLGPAGRRGDRDDRPLPQGPPGRGGRRLDRRDREGRGHDRAQHGHHARVPPHRPRGPAGASCAGCSRRRSSPTFNSISVDSDTSTSDTVASSPPGGCPAPTRGFERALRTVCGPGRGRRPQRRGRAPRDPRVRS
jgi:hypothetical protein